ncbi:MAG: ATP-binding protein [Desulfuromonadales bacterium]|jgi:serine/threonine-protein kinase RsbW|nr:ATP-binding protein [Desulfuromonadales bacterium]MDH3808809.1 ATP-binding protein [Desulfuromonadales bacterium]MDH4026613.1 ATP-binding protein [Desulfuromonadales bacterium]HKJ28577.1 ATP-binding protein [Desulfuromonadales bacterium]
MMTDRIAVDIKVPNQTRYLCLIGHIGENIARTLRDYSGDREKLAFDLNLVLTEAMANAIQHANEDNPAKEVHIEISIVSQRLIIRVFDFGTGFDVHQYIEPSPPLDEHGRGIYLIHTIMDEISYNPTEKGHVLEMVKNLN